MHIKHLISAAAIALAAGLGTASADENLGTLDGISAFDSLAGIQADPLDTDEMASVTAAHWLRVGKNGTVSDLNGHLEHYAHGGDDAHGIKYNGGKGGPVYDDYYEQGCWAVGTSAAIHGTGGGSC